jgi:hypothetical protein
LKQQKHDKINIFYIFVFFLFRKCLSPPPLPAVQNLDALSDDDDDDDESSSSSRSSRTSSDSEDEQDVRAGEGDEEEDDLESQVNKKNHI